MPLKGVLVLFLFLFFGDYVLSASDVLVFTDSNFQDEVVKHDVMLIEFYAPWCGHCKKLAPEYEKAATALKKLDPPVSLAKVDCTVETSTCSKFGVSGYPTLKIFKNGEFSKEYDGPRETNGIIGKMTKESGPISKKLETVEDARKLLSKSESVVAIGFFESEDTALAKSFMKVADQLADIKFAHTLNEEVKAELKQTEDGIVMFRPKVLQSKFEDAEVRITETSAPKIKKVIQGESLGLCGERTMGNAENFAKPLFVAYFKVDFTMNPKGVAYWRNRVMKAGKKVKDDGNTVFFAISDVGEMGRELEECGLATGSDKPVVCAYDEKNRKYKMTEEFSMDTFEKFVRDVLAGDVEVHMKSEPIPDNTDVPVKVVVAKNFDEIVNNKDKDVLIEFYAPWCGHCKSLAPKYEELATKLLGEESITIAKMDATANDVPHPYDVKGFPTIYFAPKGSKDSPKKYEGGREVADFIKYLKKESTEGLSTVSEEPKKKKKKSKKTEL